MRLGQFHLQRNLKRSSFPLPILWTSCWPPHWQSTTLICYRNSEALSVVLKCQATKHWEQPCFVFFLFSPLPSEPLCWGPPFPGSWITVTPAYTLPSFLHAWPCFVSRHLQSLVYAQCLETLTTTLLMAARLTFRGHVSTFWRKTAPPLPRPSRCWWRMMLAGPAPSPGPSR